MVKSNQDIKQSKGLGFDIQTAHHGEGRELLATSIW